MQTTDFDEEAAFRTSVAALIAAKARPFCVSGRIPVDPSSLILFFRSKVSSPVISVALVVLMLTGEEWHYTFAGFPNRY